MVNPTPRPLYSWEIDSIFIVQKSGWAPGLVSIGVEMRKLAFSGLKPQLFYWIFYAIPAPK
jgi:hypothetical protein